MRACDGAACARCREAPAATAAVAARKACAEPEEQVGSLEEARRVIRELRERHRAQAAQLMQWRRRVKAQEELCARLARERTEQLSGLAAQLLLFEARLARKQKDIASVLSAREAVILRQQRHIRALQARLSAAGLDSSIPGATTVVDGRTGPGPRTRTAAPSSTGDDEDGLDDEEDEEGCALDSLNDSDSAVVLEEALGSDVDVLSVLPRLRSAGLDPAVTVVRSVSDAVEPASKFASLRRCNGLLRRPEVLETVYSVEEDGDGDGAAPAPAHADAPQSPPADDAGGASGRGGRLQELYGSFERLHEAPSDQQQQLQQQQTPTPRDMHNPVTTYNRVMSNHRSVTKPKDVKYKRINKAKSKSLEELRGRLRNWVDKGSKLTVSLDQSYA
ncbi:hypothetical protein R5R35_001919 [Gryllus longicercus]|uniref:Uncharacterized protein n=1 Tax=Gryllus longicercus TaxID=2509291 RepID=A0AAN9ZA31_9ORTH